MKTRIVYLLCILSASCLCGYDVRAQENVMNEYPLMPEGIMKMDFLNVATEKGFKLEEFRGNVLVINVWAIWSGSSLPQIRHLISLDVKYRNRGLKVIGFNVGNTSGKPESDAKIKKFARQHSIHYDLAQISGSDLKKVYLISQRRVTPQTYVIDGKGQLRAVFTGGGRRINGLIDTTIEKLMHD